MQCPAPLLGLLSALSSSRETAVEANAYLARLPAVAQLHERAQQELSFLPEYSSAAEQMEASSAAEQVEAAGSMPLLGIEDAIPKVVPLIVTQRRHVSCQTFHSFCAGLKSCDLDASYAQHADGSRGCKDRLDGKCLGGDWAGH